MTSGSKVIMDMAQTAGTQTISASFQDAAYCGGSYCPFVIPTYPFVQPPKYDSTYTP